VLETLPWKYVTAQIIWSRDGPQNYHGARVTAGYHVKEKSVTYGLNVEWGEIKLGTPQNSKCQGSLKFLFLITDYLHRHKHTCVYTRHFQQVRQTSVQEIYESSFFNLQLNSIQFNLILYNLYAESTATKTITDSTA
jgi:hypothetical protein